MENTIENNRLIAEFMKGPIAIYHTKSGNEVGWLNYHSDWNFLQDVIEEIELKYDGKYIIQHDYDNREEFKGWYATWFTMSSKSNDRILGMLDSKRFTTKKEAYYYAVVEFIKWHNTNQKPPTQ